MLHKNNVNFYLNLARNYAIKHIAKVQTSDKHSFFVT